MKRMLLLSLVASALCSAPVRAADAEAERERARALFLEGKARFEAGEYDRAIAAFVAAGRLRPSPLLDYNIARCHERVGAHALAIQHYRRYLAGRPNAENRQEVRARVRALRRELRTRPAEPEVYDDLEAQAAAAASSAPASQPAVAASQPTSQPVVEAPTSAPAERAGPAEAAQLPPHEATLGHTGLPPPVPYRPVQRRRVPFYKHWSFWVGVGAAALIGGVIVGIAVSQANEGATATQPRTLTLPLSF